MGPARLSRCSARIKATARGAIIPSRRPWQPNQTDTRIPRGRRGRANHRDRRSRRPLALRIPPGEQPRLLDRAALQRRVRGERGDGRARRRLDDPDPVRRGAVELLGAQAPDEAVDFVLDPAGRAAADRDGRVRRWLAAPVAVRRRREAPVVEGRLALFLQRGRDLGALLVLEGAVRGSSSWPRTATNSASLTGPAGCRARPRRSRPSSRTRGPPRRRRP